MTAIIQLVFRYILLGIATAFSALNISVPKPEPIPVYKAPEQVLTFLFDKTSENPKIEAQKLQSKTIPKVEVKPQPQQKLQPAKIHEKKLITSVTPITTPAPVTSTTVPYDSYDAVVNIICIEILGNITRTTTGSGVIISPKGIILTNAHVAIDLNRNNANCTIRTGSPARNAYKAKLLYIPDRWLTRNAEFVATGISVASTGEMDLALLQITSTVSGGKVPAHISYIKRDETVLSLGDNIETSGYPAERISLFTSNSNLLRIKDTSTIKKVYSFGLTNTDVFSTGKVNNAEQGSSGGAIIVEGKLAGIIVSVNAGSINALSIGYITEYFEKDTDTRLSSLLAL